MATFGDFFDEGGADEVGGLGILEGKWRLWVREERGGFRV